MARSQKIAITLPLDLFVEIERRRVPTAETRSGFIQRLLRRACLDESETSLVRAYVAGYEQYPEEEAEVAAAQAMAESVLAGEPW